MRRARTVLHVLMVLTIWPMVAHAQEDPPKKVLSIELAFDHIDVTSGFSGAQIEVFGHRRDKFTDVAIVVKGPEKNIIVWKKAQILGAWINRYGIRYRRVPLYYGYAHTGGEVFENQETMGEIGLGIDGLMKGKADLKNPATKTDAYQAALVNSMRAKKVYPEEPQQLNFINDYFFRTRFLLPASAPTGTYKIQSYLFKDGKLIESDTDTMKVEQVGLNAFVHESAQDHAVLYGIVSILLALASGWFVGILRVRP